MPFSHNVVVWKLAKRTTRKRAHGVRWRVDSRQFSKWFTTHALADSERSKLMRAARAGEGFDTETGQPESVVRELQDVTFYALACQYVDMKWPHAAAKTRTSMADALATVAPVLVSTDRGRPPEADVRRTLYGWAFHTDRRKAGEPPADVAKAAAWLETNSLKVTELDVKERRSEIVRRALDRIALRMDGKPAAATTVARKRAVFYGVLSYAVELDFFAANPIDRVRWSAPKTAEEVDRRVVAGPVQMRALLKAVRAERPDLVAFFACAYYALMRPGEIVSLRRAHCHLPAGGWGRLTLSESAPRSSTGWTNTGATHDPRQLKHRARKATRDVPIPPVLVRLLQRHLNAFGTAPDGRLFRSASGGVLSESVYGRTWHKARKRALSAEQVESPLAGRTYDLRHAGITLGLNAGVPAPELARRAGHSVDVLMRIYAGCIDGHENLWNDRIDDTLGEPPEDDE